MKAKITLVVCFCVLAAAQDPSGPPWPEERKRSQREEEMTERRKKEYNAQRRKEMTADADKILGLAGEIKESVKPEEAAPPASVMAKLENVEKLARRIKNKMQENANITDARRPAPARRTMGRAASGL